MSFGIGLLCYVLGSVAVAICLWSIPGPGGEAQPQPDPHHGGH
jgi:hypothetical protein